MMNRLLLGLGLACAVAGAARAEVTLQDRQQAACYGDAQRLCGEFIPDAKKTEACMSQMKDKVSARCRAFYED